MKSYRLLIVDDHQLFSAGLCSLLHSMNPSIEVIEIDSAVQALSRFEKGELFDLVLVDMKMPNMNGLQLMAAVQARNLNVRVAVISENTDISVIQSTIDNGAVGYIPKTCAPLITLDGIRCLLNGKKYVPPHLEQYVFFDMNLTERKVHETCTDSQTPDAQFSDRQVEIVKLLSDGKSNKTIANILGLSQSTVKFHLSSLFKKLGVSTRTECVIAAVRNNLISTSSLTRSRSD